MTRFGTATDSTSVTATFYTARPAPKFALTPSAACDMTITIVVTGGSTTASSTIDFAERTGNGTGNSTCNGTLYLGL